MKATTTVAVPLVLATVLAALLLVACPQPNGVHPPTAPAAPSGLNAIAQSSSSIQIVWSDNSNNEDSFVLEYDTIADFSAKVEISLPQDTTDKLVEGLDPSTKHYFRVKAINDVGASAYSNVDEATTQAPPLQAPAAPSALTATAASSSSIQTGWTDNSDNEDNFVIAYSKTADFAASSETILPANTTAHLVGSLDANTKYYLRVKATNAAGPSAWSDTAEATTLSVIEGTMVINGGSAYTNSTNVTINSNIAAAAQMRFQNAGGLWSAWEAYGASKAWTITSGEGTKTVNGEFQDAVGTVLAKSDSIILNTTPPSVQSFLINAGATYTTSTNVTLSWTANDAVHMRFQNDGAAWSAWEPYAASKAWTLLSGDEGKKVYAQFLDAAGNSRIVSDDIILDTQAPIVSYFKINDGDSSTNKTAVILDMSVEGAVLMRFANEGGQWSSWQASAMDRSWTITAGENTDRYVYAQFRDAAWNFVQVYDSIYYDAIRRLRITAEKIVIEQDADKLDAGEIFWEFYVYDTSDTKVMIYSQPPFVVLNDGQTYDFADISVVVAMSNFPGESYRVGLRIDEDDGILGIAVGLEGTVTYFADAGWGIGDTRTLYGPNYLSIAGSIRGPIMPLVASGWMYFKVEQVD